MNRYDVVNAYAALVALHGDTWLTDAKDKIRTRLDKKAVRDITDVCRPYACVFGSRRRFIERADVLDALEPEAFAGYFQLVKRHLGESEAIRLSEEWARINDPAGVEIQVEPSDDDPFQITFSVSDPIANEWAEKHGSLDGGTWECADGPDFVYDIGYWHKDLFEGLKEYNLDFSQWSDPEESDFIIATHAGHCDECSGDFRQAEKHMEEQLEETAKKKLAQG